VTLRTGSARIDCGATDDASDGVHELDIDVETIAGEGLAWLIGCANVAGLAVGSRCFALHFGQLHADADPPFGPGGAGCVLAGFVVEAQPHGLEAGPADVFGSRPGDVREGCARRELQ
jgi:hypothetical protein